MTPVGPIGSWHVDDGLTGDQETILRGAYEVVGAGVPFSVGLLATLRAGYAPSSSTAGRS